MALFVYQRNTQHPRQPVHVANGHKGCPQPMCLHPAHNGIPVPTKQTGTSLLDGLVVHHVRCVLNSAHHRQFVQMGNRWHEVKSR